MRRVRVRRDHNTPEYECMHDALEFNFRDTPRTRRRATMKVIRCVRVEVSNVFGDLRVKHVVGVG